MCGICGELRLDGKPPDREVVLRMMHVLAPRGPDDAGAYHDERITLGHRRLSVIDLSPSGHQPMVEPALGLVLVFNGTIYNFRELRAKLEKQGHSFRSQSDTEVILKAYAQWGERCPEHLHGMFAFALWDSREGKLFMARDRIGIKPLYYALSKDRICFASNTQALLSAGNMDTRIDPVALHHHLTLHAVVPAPRTILKGIRKLPPASTMTISSSGLVETRRYWSLEAKRPGRAPTEQEWLALVRDALVQAVEKRLQVADVPVGVLLSGGLDSSLLVALLAQSGVADLRTFSVGFEDSPEEQGSEFEYSDLVVDRFNPRHHRIHIDNTEVLDRLPDAVQAMAEPMVAQDAIAFYLLAEKVSRHVKVVQSGQGADEVFAGYFWYPLMQATSGSDLERFRRHYFDRDHEELLEAVTPIHYGPDVTSQLIDDLLAEPAGDTFMDRVLRLDVTTLIVDDPVKRVDNMTMAWGLEARVPFLDHHIVELAATMPPELKMRGGGKYPLKRMARGLLPDAVIDRPKGYFPVPALKFIRGAVLDFIRTILTSEACSARRLFQPGYLDKLLSAPERHMTPIRGNKLWHAALLEMWLQTHVDRC